MRNFILKGFISILLLCNLASAGTLDPRLRQFIPPVTRNSSPDEAPARRIPILVVMKNQGNVTRIRQAAIPKLRSEVDDLTAFTFRDLRDHHENLRLNILAKMQELERHGHVDAPVPFWIINAMALNATGQVLQQIADHPDVETVIYDETRKLLPVTRPGHDNALNRPWGLDMINVDAAHKAGYFGAGVTVYVIDSGIQLNHPAFFSGQILKEKSVSFVYGDSNANDFNGHGTHCAGTIASEKYGIATKANLVAVKVLDGDGAGSISGVIKGIEYAASNGADVISMSLGWDVADETTRPLDMATRNAEKGGVFVSVATTNNGPGRGTIGSPDQVEEIMSVGAAGRNGQATEFSGRGPAQDGTEKPNILGPGEDIRSTWIGGGTNVESGTSMGNPHVAGTAALIVGKSKAEIAKARSRGASPQQLSRMKLTPQQIKRILMSTATGKKIPNVSGAGVVNCEGALTAPLQENSLVQALKDIGRRIRDFLG